MSGNKRRSRLECWLAMHLRVWSNRTEMGIRWVWRHLRHARSSSLPIEVLVTDPTRRRVVERQLTTALAQLQRAVTTPVQGRVTVVVQQVIATDHQLAGCCQIIQHADGSRFALLRLALQVNGEPVTPDELLAVLAEQYIGLATQSTGSASVLVPVDLKPPSRVSRHDALAPDLGASYRNGNSHHVSTSEKAV